MTHIKTLIAGLIMAGAATISGPALSLDLNPLSAIKSMVEAAVEDRSSEDIAKDLELKAKITAEVIDKLGTDVISIGADVYEQIVMLTGVADKAELKTQAGRLAAGVEGVKKVYNEMLVIKPINKKKGAAEAFVDDTVIESKINALLLDGQGVNVTNMRWRSVQGHVFLFGRALSSDERAKAVSIVKGIDNVLSVTSRMFVRPKN
jgi:hyperosmotically inducible periplasmic protein